MKAVKPERREHWSEIVLGKHQSEYLPLPANRSTDRTSTVETKWELDEVDRAKIAAGEAIYLSVLTFDLPFAPVRLQVGRDDDASADETSAEINATHERRAVLLANKIASTTIELCNAPFTENGKWLCQRVKGHNGENKFHTYTGEGDGEFSLVTATWLGDAPIRFVKVDAPTSLGRCYNCGKECSIETCSICGQIFCGVHIDDHYDGDNR